MSGNPANIWRLDTQGLSGGTTLVNCVCQVPIFLEIVIDVEAMY